MEDNYPCTADINSFELNKLITFSNLFSKITITLSSKLVLRCLADFWNANSGYTYPKQSTIQKCTGLSHVSVIAAIKELEEQGLIYTSREDKRIKYYFTLKFFTYLDGTPIGTLEYRLKNLRYLPKDSLGHKHIYKYINNKENLNNFNLKNFNPSEQTSLNTPSDQTDKCTSPYDNFECAVNWLKTAEKFPMFAARVKEVKKLWGICDK